MTIARLSLSVFLILLAISLFGWVDIENWVIGLFAIIAGVLLLLEDAALYSYRIGR